VFRANYEYRAVKSCHGCILNTSFCNARAVCVHGHQLLWAAKTRSVAGGEKNERELHRWQPNLGVIGILQINV
jgi:hypothetical protein